MIELFMKLLERMVKALEGIDRSLGNAGKDAVSGAGLQMDPYAPNKVAGDLQGRQANDLLKDVPGIARRPSNINDISMVSAEILERSRAASVTFAIDNMTVPWSEAHMRALIAYERKVDAEFGDGSSEKLPWRNLIPRGEDVGR